MHKTSLTLVFSHHQYRINFMRLRNGFFMFLIIAPLLMVGPVWAQKKVQNQTRFLGFDNGQQGLGLLVGKPTGLRYTYWLNWRRAMFIDGAYDLDGIVQAQGSYAYYFYDAKDQFKKSRGFNSFLFYVAPGLMTGFRVSGSDQASAFLLGIRGAGGLEYVLGRGTWALRAELGGTINVIGRTFASLQGFLGMTYYWGSSGKSKGSSSAGSSKKSTEDPEFEEFE